MTDELDYTAKIRAKGLASTGVTEEVARTMYGNRGGHYMLIVEAHVQETHDKAEGQHKVDLVLTQVEPATDARLESHLRDLTRALHHQRKLHSEDEQPQLQGVGDVVPSVGEVIAQGDGLFPEAPDDASDEPPWEYPQGEGQAADGERDEVPVT